MRVIIAPGAFGDTLDAPAAAAAIAAGWRRAAPADDLALLPVTGSGPAGLDAALEGAGLVVCGEGSFDWRSLRDSAVTAIARSAAARGVPCVVLAGQVSVGRREAAAVGIDAAYPVADDPGGGARSPAGPLTALAEKVARRWSR